MSTLSAPPERSSAGRTGGPNDGDDLLAASEARLDLRVGAVVVYGGYGLGRVARAHKGSKGAYSSGSVVVLEFADGLSVTLPRRRALICLRSVADEDELARVRDALHHDGATFEKSWQARTRSTRTKIAAGHAVGLAEVVRDGAARQRASAGGALSMHELELYLKARRLLVAELGVAMGAGEAHAEAWIDGELEASAAGCGEHVPR